MDNISLRVACLKAASRMAGSADELLRLSFAFECYAVGGYNCGSSALQCPPQQYEPAPAVTAEPTQAAGPKVDEDGVWLDPLHDTIRFH